MRCGSRRSIRRSDVSTRSRGEAWPRAPDGAPLHPQAERRLSRRERQRRIADGEPFAWRLDIDAASAHAGRGLAWDEEGHGPAGETGRIDATPEAWGDVVIARKETPTSYHLSVVVDDAIQGVTHVVRGRDLFFATSVQRLLQQLLGLPAPAYFHHDLILGDDGRKLSKSRGDTGIAALRAAGTTPGDIARMVGLHDDPRA